MFFESHLVLLSSVFAKRYYRSYHFVSVKKIVCQQCTWWQQKDNGRFFWWTEISYLLNFWIDQAHATKWFVLLLTVTMLRSWETCWLTGRKNIKTTDEKVSQTAKMLCCLIDSGNNWAFHSKMFCCLNVRLFTFKLLFSTFTGIVWPTSEHFLRLTL